MRNRYNLVGLYSGWVCRNLSKIWTGVKCVWSFLSSCFSISLLSISSSCCPSSSLFVFTLRRRHSSSSPIIVVAFLFLSGPFRVLAALHLRSSSSLFVVAIHRRPSSSLFFVALVVVLHLHSSSSPFLVALVESTTLLCLLCVLRRVVS